MLQDLILNDIFSSFLTISDKATLKNAQDLDRSNRMKDLAKGCKDPDELAQHRRRENKKHVEQSVEERQKVPGIFSFNSFNKQFLPALTWKANFLFSHPSWA